jgi:hypothetical protein
MRAILLIGLTTLAVSPATAQFTTCTPNGPFVQCNSTDGSMTNCNRTGTIVNCNTIGGDTMAAPPPNNGGALPGMVNAIREAHHRKVMAKLAAAVQADDCPTALGLAANSGDVQTMIAVKQFCDGRPAASPPTHTAQSNRPMSPYEAGRLAAKQQSGGQP